MAGSSRSLVTRTYVFDSLRHGFQGALDSAFLTLGLLIAIRVFHAPNSMKTILAALTWLGGITSPLVTRWAARTGWKATHLALVLFLLIAASFWGAAFVSSFPVYLLLISFASTCFRSESAVLIGLYMENYSPKERASRLGLGLTLAAIVGIVFGQCSGKILDWNLDYYRQLLFAVAGCALLCGICLLFIPSSPVQQPHQPQGRAYFTFLFRDRLFGKLTLYFFFVGLAYQMLIPIKMEYLANTVYGLHLSNFTVMLLSWGLPNLGRVLSTQPFGFLFDRTRLITSRLWVCYVTLAGIAIFFNATTPLWLSVGSLLMGLAMAGSYVLHSLWISKITGAENLSAYQATYLLVSGIRSMLAPVLGYALLSVTSPTFVGNFAAGLVLISIIGFWTERHNPAIR
jgi:MFS family permease